jgi:hypothetical protein
MMNNNTTKIVVSALVICAFVVIANLMHTIGRLEGQVEFLQNSVNMAAKNQQRSTNFTQTVPSTGIQAGQNSIVNDENYGKKIIFSESKNNSEVIKGSEKDFTKRAKAALGPKLCQNVEKNEILSAPELDNKLVKNQTPAVAVKSTEPEQLVSQNRMAKILVVQQKQRRVVINAGLNKGIKKRQAFSLWRENNYIGEVKVKAVFANMAVCEIIACPSEGIRVSDYITANTTEMAQINN